MFQSDHLEGFAQIFLFQFLNFSLENARIIATSCLPLKRNILNCRMESVCFFYSLILSKTPYPITKSVILTTQDQATTHLLGLFYLSLDQTKMKIYKECLRSYKQSEFSELISYLHFLSFSISRLTFLRNFVPSSGGIHCPCHLLHTGFNGAPCIVVKYRSIPSIAERYTVFILTIY